MEFEMANARLSKRSVDGLKPGSKDVFLWDTDRKGFGVKRTPTGKLIYILQYRMHGGRDHKVKRYTIGKHGSWTPELAGKEAERLLRMVSQGVDPALEAAKKKKEAISLAFSDYADRYLEEHLKIAWPRAYTFPKANLKNHLKPAFGDTPLPKIDVSRLNDFFDNLPKDKPGLRRNVFVVLRRMLRWAKGRGDIAVNPLGDFEGPPPVSGRDRVIEDEELPILWLASKDISPKFGSLVRLLLLTGQRRNEVARLRWEELDRAKKRWLLPASRAKNAIEALVPLSELAVLELDLLADSTTWPRRGLVLTTNGTTPISGFSKSKKALDEAMLVEFRKVDPEAELVPWRFHDLRRTMATTMQRLRISSDVIEACENRIAGQSKPGSARIYQRHDYELEKREAFDKWTAFLIEIQQDAELHALP